MPNLVNYLVFSTSWVAIVFLIVNQLGRSESLWVALLGTVIVAAPILTTRLYSLTIRRIHNLSAYHQRGILFSLFSSRIIMTVCWLVYSLVFGYFTLLWLIYLSWLEWLLALLTIPALWLVFRRFQRLVQGEFKPYLVFHRALGITGWIVPLAMTALYIIAMLLKPLLVNLVSNASSPVAGIGGLNTAADSSQFMQLTLLWSQTFHDLKRVAFDYSGGFSFLQLFLVVLPTSALFLNLSMVCSAFLIPGAELRRIVNPLSNTAEPGPVGFQTALQTTAYAIVLLLFILPGVASLLEQQVRNSSESVQLLEELRQQVIPTAERIGERIMRPGTVAEVDALKLETVRAIDARATLVDAALAEGFEKLRANVDPFLDSYYSLPQEYLRIASLVSGNIETRIRNELTINLLAGEPFAEYERLLAELLAGNEAIRIDYQNNLEALLAEMELSDGSYQIVESRPLNTFELPSMENTPSVTTARARGGAGVISGAIVTAVVAKITAKGLIKLAATAVTKAIGSKAVTGAAGTATGAVIGSVIPGLGTLAGAAVGAVVGIAAGVSVDYFLLRLEEEFNRDEFRAELIESINAQEQEVMGLGM
jgi:hypothetical protein